MKDARESEWVWSNLQIKEVLVTKNNINHSEASNPIEDIQSVWSFLENFDWFIQSKYIFLLNEREKDGEKGESSQQYNCQEKYPIIGVLVELDLVVNWYNGIVKLGWIY